MKNLFPKTVFCGICLMLAFLQSLHAQDKVYKTSGTVLEGKVTEVNPKEIRFIQKDRPDGLVYFIRVSELDSIVYSNGTRDIMQGVTMKKGLLENIPQLNTWTYDLLGFTFLSVSQSYERRLKNGKVGFRIPLYVGFQGGGFAGEGTFIPKQGVLYNEVVNGFCIATGLNPKFYLFKRRIIRAFIGPEVTIGYSSGVFYGSDYFGYFTYKQRGGTFDMVGKAGLMINPVDKFNITIDGGAGAGSMFATGTAQPWVGIWHIGLALGTNF